MIRAEFHEAHVNIETGDGVAVLPDPDADVVLGCESVLSAVLADAARDLDRMDWEFAEGDDPWGWGLSLDRRLPDGRIVVGLYGRESIRSEVSLADRGAAFADLLDLVTRR